MARSISIIGDIGLVPLTRGFVAVIDAADAELVSGWSWHALVGARGNVYAARGVSVHGRKSAILMHRQIIGESAADVDHISGDGLDNRRVNLRACSRQDNLRNMRMSTRNRVGLKGVYPARDRFAAGITVDGRSQYLGTFSTPEEAHRAYVAAAKRLFGSFAREDLPPPPLSL